MIDCGIIRTDPGSSEGERMVEIARDLRQIIRTHKPDLASVEKFFFLPIKQHDCSSASARGVDHDTHTLWPADCGIPANANQAGLNWPWACGQERSARSSDA
jgi:hypothetical protein